MPVNLSDIRTFAADSVRVQRLQELQQLASRTHQAQLSSEFDRALDLRRASVKETDETENPGIRRENQSPDSGNPRNPDGGSAESSPDQAQASSVAAAVDGIGENIDLRG